VVGHYESFFITSAGASAAILGLLVVAVTVVNADDANPTTRELRTVLAGSAFVALVDIFIVSIVALTGGSVVFGLSSLAMAAVGQFVLAVALLAKTQSAALQRALVLVIVALYCSALGRIWVVTGITRRVTEDQQQPGNDGVTDLTLGL
jgi:hypothetical protein